MLRSESDYIQLNTSSSGSPGSSLVELGSIRQPVDLGRHLLTLRGSESSEKALSTSTKAPHNHLDRSAEHVLLLKQLKGSHRCLESTIVLSSLLLLDTKMSTRKVESHLLGSSHLLQQLLVDGLGHKRVVDKLVGRADVQVVLGGRDVHVVSHHLLALGALVDQSLCLSSLVELCHVRLGDLADLLLYCVSGEISRFEISIRVKFHDSLKIEILKLRQPASLWGTHAS